MLKSLLAGAIVALTAFSVSAPSHAEGVPLQNKVIEGFPPFQPPDAPILLEDGTTGTLRDFPGELVVATFWYTRCPPCQIEMPQINELAGLLAEQGVSNIRFLPISIDEFTARTTTEGAAGLVREYLDRRGFANLPVAVDVRAANYAALRPDGTPTTFFIAPSGDVVAVVEGATMIRANAVDWTSPDTIAYLRSLAGV